MITLSGQKFLNLYAGDLTAHIGAFGRMQIFAGGVEISMRDVKAYEVHIYAMTQKIGSRPVFGSEKDEIQYLKQRVYSIKQNIDNALKVTNIFSSILYYVGSYFFGSIQEPINKMGADLGNVRLAEFVDHNEKLSPLPKAKAPVRTPSREEAAADEILEGAGYGKDAFTDPKEPSTESEKSPVQSSAQSEGIDIVSTGYSANNPEDSFMLDLPEVPQDPYRRRSAFDDILSRSNFFGENGGGAIV